MIKKILLMVFCIVVLGAAAYADVGIIPAASQTNIEQIHTDELLAKIKAKHNEIYKGLDLSAEQMSEINILNGKYYSDIEQKLEKISQQVQKIENIANSDNCTKEQIDKVAGEFKVVEKELNLLKDKHEKKFRKILTLKQRFKYEHLRRDVVSNYLSAPLN